MQLRHSVCIDCMLFLSTCSCHIWNASTSLFRPLEKPPKLNVNLFKPYFIFEMVQHVQQAPLENKANSMHVCLPCLHHLPFSKNTEFSQRCAKCKMLTALSEHVICVALCSLENLLKSHQGTIWNQLEHRQCRMIHVLTWENPTNFFFSQICLSLIGRKHRNLIFCLFNFLYFQICLSSNRQKTQKPRKHAPATVGHTILKLITRRSSDGWSNLCGSRF